MSNNFWEFTFFGIWEIAFLRARPSPLSSLPRLRRGRKEDGKAAGAPSFPPHKTALHSMDGLAHRRRRRTELGFMCVFCLEEGGKKRGGAGLKIRGGVVYDTNRGCAPFYSPSHPPQGGLSLRLHWKNIQSTQNSW